MPAGSVAPDHGKAPVGARGNERLSPAVGRQPAPCDSAGGGSPDGPILASFSAQFPDIKIEVTADDCVVDTVSGHYDAGIALRGHVADTMVAVPASGDIRRIVVGAPSYFRNHGSPRTPDELSQHHCIRLRTPSGGIEPWQFVRGNKTFTVPVDGALVLVDVELAVRIALSGGGLVHVPESCARTAIESGTLQGILQGWMPRPSDGFVLYYPSQRHNPAALRCLVAFLREGRATSGSPPCRPSSPPQLR